ILPVPTLSNLLFFQRLTVVCVAELTLQKISASIVIINSATHIEIAAKKSFCPSEGAAEGAGGIPPPPGPKRSPAAPPEYLEGRTPKRKNVLSILEKIHSRENQKSKEHFFFLGLPSEARRGRGDTSAILEIGASLVQ